MKPAYVGIDVAFAKKKRLPVAVCIREGNRVVPLPLRRVPRLVPPKGRGNRLTLDPEVVRVFAEETRDYLRQVANVFGLSIQRIAIDAPSAPCSSGRRRAEQALDAAGYSCITTPTQAQFDEIKRKVKAHLENGGSESSMPHANQLWMLVGFELFKRLSKDAPCLEVFPNATVQVLGAASIAKSQKDGVSEQLRATKAYTGWPSGTSDEPRLPDICHGSLHDKLDAYLCAWVASLEESDRDALGNPPDDVIWVPKLGSGGRAPAQRFTGKEQPLELPLEVPKERGVLKPRTCPACKSMVFKRWPFGWDAHAAYRCDGLESTEPDARKQEFKDRWSHLFRSKEV